MRVIQFLFSVLTVLTWQFASAAQGPISSGGGAGIICPATVPTQPAVQLLDLFEGRVEGLDIPESNVPYLDQLAQVQQLLGFDFSLQKDFAESLAYLRTNHKFLPPGVSIQVPADLGQNEAVLLPTGCTIGSIGYYEASGVLKISYDSFNALSETQKAAFWAHETFYRLVRYYARTEDREKLNAKSTRLFVAALFSRAVTSGQLFELSTVANWRNLPGSESKGNWTPAPGRENWFSYLGNDTPVPLRLPVLDRVFRLEVDSAPGRGAFANLSCQNRYPSSWQYIAREEGYNGRATAEGRLPAGCQELVLMVAGGGVPPLIPVQFRLYYDGELILTGVFTGYPFFGPSFPIYLQ